MKKLSRQELIDLVDVVARRGIPVVDVDGAGRVVPLAYRNDKFLQ